MSSRNIVSSASKKILRNVQNNLQDAALGVICSGMTGSSINFKSIPVKSPLTSASLLCSYIKNHVIRREEIPQNFVNRIFFLFQPKSSLWNTVDTSELKFSQMMESINALKLKLNGLRAKAISRSNDLDITKQFIDTQVKLNNMKKLVACMNRPDGSVYTSLYPCSVDSVTSQSMSPAMESVASKNVHINGYKRILGIYIRIAGPRRGNRKRVWRKGVGAYSTTDPSSVVFEEAQTQLPSKIGTFGLKVKIVYSKKDRLANINTKLPRITGESMPCGKSDNVLFGIISPGVSPPKSLDEPKDEQNLREVFHEATASSGAN